MHTKRSITSEWNWKDALSISPFCYLNRHDECTERGFKHHIFPFLTQADRNPCQCPCKHKETPVMVDYAILQLYQKGILE